jgi:hypothetical protein
MTGRPAHPDPEGHHDDLDPADAARLTLIVPDDARALEPDRLAWLAEDHDRPRLPRLDSLALPEITLVASRHPRPRRRLAVVAAITACAVLGLSVLSAGMALVSPNNRPSTTSTPLAVASADPGELDGLLPAATLTGDTGSVASTDLRPAVVALVPSTCADCGSRLANVSSQAAEYGLPLVLVGGPDQHAQLGDLAGRLPHQASALVDREQTLRQTFAATATSPDSLLLLLVRADGTLYTVVNDPAADARLEPALVHLGTTVAR